MDKLILALPKRVFFPAVLFIAFVLWVGLCRAYHESYWEGTIKRVQTVDFNMLHHTLPTTLSYLILTGQDSAVQKVLNSTYGIFGLVITDPQGTRIVYKTDTYYKSKTWQNFLSMDYLNKLQHGAEHEPFDYLTDPPPQTAAFIHESPRIYAAKKAGSLPPKARVIGRLYYVRGIPPAFHEDVLSSLLTFNWWESTGSKRGYVLLTLNIFAFSLLAIMGVLWRKNILETKARELDAAERELQIKRRALDHLNADLSSQRQRKEWLESEANLAYERAVRLKDSLQKLKEAFFMVDMSPHRQEAGAETEIKVRPPLTGPAEIMAEVESLLPELTNNAKILRSQAEVLQTYCTQLEIRQAEMQQILAQPSGEGDARGGAGYTPISHLTAEQTTP